MWKNVKILENSKKIKVTPMDPKDPSTTIFKPVNQFFDQFWGRKVKIWTFFGPWGTPKNEQRPKKGFLGVLKGPQGYPDFFRIFQNFHIFDM